MIETKEQYEEYQRKIIAVVENRYDPTEIWRTIEALREVARRANEGWRAYELPDDVEQSLKDALATLPDWLLDADSED